MKIRQILTSFTNTSSQIYLLHKKYFRWSQKIVPYPQPNPNPNSRKNLFGMVGGGGTIFQGTILRKPFSGQRWPMPLKMFCNKLDLLYAFNLRHIKCTMVKFIRVVNRLKFSRATCLQGVSSTYYKSNSKFPWSEKYLPYKKLGSCDTHMEKCVAYSLPT